MFRNCFRRSNNYNLCTGAGGCPLSPINPTILNGNYNVSQSDIQNSLDILQYGYAPDGTVVSIQCNAGYTLVPAGTTATCSEGAWTPTFPPAASCMGTVFTRYYLPPYTFIFEA